MNTIELSAALGQAQVVENLKNFVGVDAQGAAALMTPERLAAVAGGLPFKKPITDNETLDATTDSGLYQVSGFSSIPYGILIVFEGSNLVCQKLIGSASILFRMKSKTSSWPVWKELKGVEHQTVL